MAFRFSAAEGLCSLDDADRAVAAIAASGLPSRLSDLADRSFAAQALLRHMAQDKKAEGGRLTFILVRALGEAFVARDVDENRMRDFLKSEGAV